MQQFDADAGALEHANDEKAREERFTAILKNSFHRIHLLGIAGAAMASIAGMLKERGYEVSGSDKGVYPPASTLLDSLGIKWHKGFREENLRPAPDLVVVGNAISRGNPELEAVLDEKIPYWSMPQVIEELFLPGRDALVVAGTHGKTTTTSMLAWIFQCAGRKPDFLIGGAVPDFGDRGYDLGGGNEFIIEGDEYDSAYFDKAPKFLHYHPRELILTSLEFDHADIYPDLASIDMQFRRLVNLVPRRGKIFVWGEAPNNVAAASKAFCSVETYGLSPEMDWYAGDIEWRDERTHFRVVHGGKERVRIRLRLSGRHNVMNALACIALAFGRGIERGAIEAALEKFQGVRRRLETKAEANGIAIVEDFAHHPTAIRMTIEAARSRWPVRRIWAAFEPRSNTMRRKLMQDALAESLACADGVALGPVNRANLLLDAERMDPHAVAAEIRRRGKIAQAFGSAAEIADFFSRELRSGDLVLVMSNGSFDSLCARLVEIVRSRALGDAAPAERVAGCKGRMVEKP